MNYMAMAGWKTEDMLNGVEGIMNLAAASGEDLATTSDIVTDALTALGMSADDWNHRDTTVVGCNSDWPDAWRLCWYRNTAVYLRCRLYHAHLL